MSPPSSQGPRVPGGPRRPPRGSGGSRPGSNPATERYGGARKRSPSRKPKLRSRLPAWAVSAVAGLLVTGVVCAALLWWWGRVPTAAAPSEYRRVDLGASTDTGHALDALEAAGLIEQPTLLAIYQHMWRPWFEVAPGVHWISAGRSPAALLALLARSPGREAVRVTFPEGWDSFQIAERLAASGICDREEFLRAVFVGPSDENGESSAADSPWSSFEGRLYPAAYDLRLDSAATDVVARLVAEADKRHRATFETHHSELTRLGRELELTAGDIVTLASVVEKEAANDAELALVASVFLNRLRDPAFRPQRMLQSDPTAAYGCKRDPGLNSCRQFTGKVTPAMLRDGMNAFNTYRHAGLPPTPIGNPSTRALVAVLTAPATQYFFFVSPDGGPHHFSRTFDEHERHLR